MVRTFLKVYMELCSYFLFLQEQIKDIIIIEHAAWLLASKTRSRQTFLAIALASSAAP
jgi:hypothetical protein